MKKNVIFVLNALWVGGIEQALVTLLPGLVEEFDLTCLIFSDHRELADRLPESCRLVLIDREKSPFTWLYHLTEQPNHPSFCHRLFLWAVPLLRWAEERLFARYVRRTLGGEVFDSAVVYSDAVSAIALRGIRARDFHLVYHQGRPRKIPGDRRAWRKCRKIIAVSEPLSKELRAFRHQYAEKIVAIPNLVEGNRVRNQAEAFNPGFSREVRQIVSVGRLHRDKGMDLAVEAAGILKNRGLDFHWWILGGGPEEEALKAQIRELGLSDTVSLTGLQTNPYPYMARADVYVQPSRQEGYGLTIAEAAVLGKPVIATDTAGARAQLPEELLCGISGKAIADAVGQALKNASRPVCRDWETENQKALEMWKRLLNKEKL